MAAVTTYFGEDLPAHPATRRAVPRAAIARARRQSPAVYWRRRLAVVGMAVGLVVVAAQAGDALGGSPLAAPERHPASSTTVEVTARPGDSLWSMVQRTFPDDDPRPRVDELMAARRGVPLVPGERVGIPREGIELGRDGDEGGDYRGRVRCPYCGIDHDKVVDSRPSDEGAAVRRRRECLDCGERFTTYERHEEAALMVRKRSGEVVPFDRAKLDTGIQLAIAGRAVAPDAAGIIADDVEERARSHGSQVKSEFLGLAVLEHLRTLDPVSYLRFASVYKGFEDVGDFEREVVELQKTPLETTTLQKTTAPKRR